MISIAKVNNAKYHLEHSQFDYYSEQENEKGEFRGALMKWQKLEGKEVDEKNYMKQISHGGEDNKGVDLCFSPPKDWTLLYNMADDETRQKMDVIRDKAVDKIVKGIEQNTYYRETKDGETEYKLAKGVGMATFNHHTSREVQDDKINPGGYVDPQEHTHITVFPKVLGQDGKFHSHTLLDLKYEKGNNHEGLRHLDQLGQYELSKGLKEMGFNTYEIDKHGNFGIEGIDDNLRDEFSKRKEQINDKAGEGATYSQKKEIALNFRAGKDSHDLASLRSVWKERMNELGFNQEKINEMRKPENHTIKHEDKKLADLIDKDKPLSNKKLKTLALNESKFTDKSYDEKLKEFKDDKKVRPLSKKYNLYADNKAKEKLADKVNEKSNQPKANIGGSNSAEDGKGMEQLGKQLQGAIKGLQGGSSGANAGSVPAGGSGGGGSNGGSKVELYSEIDNLQLQMMSFPPVAERTPEQHKQVAQIEAQIGQLKEQIKTIEEQEKEANLSGSSANSGSGGSQGSKQQKPKDQKQPETPEEKEEALLNDKADKMNEVLKNEDKIKDGSSSSKLAGIQKDFKNDHKAIVSEITQGQTQQLTITR
ncbi:MobF family relaxase [Burkholderia vietnamiensis]|uniref:MobF family relaxase n=1 Tax=Burkholderia vietnamiensis TaxID=60552 RepID=UPI00159417A8|nr:MobF family relaxase [Burkholderia vietnamiensis]